MDYKLQRRCHCEQLFSTAGCIVNKRWSSCLQRMWIL